MFFKDKKRVRVRSIKIPPKKRAKLQSRLYRKLRKEAFDNYFHCAQCGSHKDLQIHHLRYDPDRFDDPSCYVILCERCHRRVKRS